MVGLTEEANEVKLLIATDAKKATRKLLQCLEHAIFRVSFHHGLIEIEARHIVLKHNTRPHRRTFTAVHLKLGAKSS